MAENIVLETVERVLRARLLVPPDVDISTDLDASMSNFSAPSNSTKPFQDDPGLVKAFVDMRLAYKKDDPRMLKWPSEEPWYIFRFSKEVSDRLQECKEKLEEWKDKKEKLDRMVIDLISKLQRINNGLVNEQERELEEIHV